MDNPISTERLKRQADSSSNAILVLMAFTIGIFFFAWMIHERVKVLEKQPTIAVAP